MGGGAEEGVLEAAEEGEGEGEGEDGDGEEKGIES